MSVNKPPHNKRELDKFYQDAMSTIGALLIHTGFSEESLEFRRYARQGFDRIAITLPDTRSFSVVMSYYPEAVKWVNDLEPKPGYDPDFGFPCGPYLNQFRVDNRPKTWPIGEGKTERSLHLAVTALKDIGLPWLERLRDPSFFADSVDKVVYQLRGAALEVAGRFEEAKEQYLRRIDVLERCRDIPRLPLAEQKLRQAEIDRLKHRIAGF